MIHIIINAFGYFGGILLTVQLFPQIYKVIKTKSSSDISPSFLYMNIIGLASMTLYGLYHNARPVFISSGLSLINTSILLFFVKSYSNIIRHDKLPDQV